MTMTDSKDSRSERSYAEMIKETQARYPKACRACGSDQIQPTFLAPKEWDCSSCCAIWSEDY